MIKFKRLHIGAVVPVKQHITDAAYDLVVPEDTVIAPDKSTIVKLGFAMQLPLGYGAIIKGRSGFDSKGIEDNGGYRHINTCVRSGLIDSGYRGEVGVIVYNDSSDEFIVPAGTRIAQMIILKCEDMDFVEVDSLDESDRDGGFGSTGARV